MKPQPCRIEVFTQFGIMFVCALAVTPLSAVDIFVKDLGLVLEPLWCRRRARPMCCSS